ncbi:PIG-L family deacetylase [Ignavibacteriales bacterium]
MEKVLIVSVHPDDETIGMGGTILKLKDQNKKLFWLNITNGNEYQVGYIKPTAEFFGFKEVFNLGFPEITLSDECLRDIIPEIHSILKNIQCDTIFLPNRSDIHTDHQISFKAVVSAAKNFRHNYIRKILMYETLSETEYAPALPENIFIPNVYSDISEYLARKLEAVKIFESEILGDQSPRSLKVIEALNRFRGSRIGVDYAETFMLLLDQI